MLLLLLAMLPLQEPAQAQGGPRVAVKSVFAVDRYGFATINESVRFTNNESSAVSPPSLTFGFGNLSSKIAGYNVTGGTFSVSSQGAGSYTVSGGQTIQPNGNASYVLSVLVNGIVSTAKNGSLQLLTLSTPSISQRVDSLVNTVKLPTATTFRSVPTGLKVTIAGNGNYTSSSTGAAPASAVTSVRAIAQSTIQDFFPLHIFYEVRTITAAPDGTPLVVDKVKFQNMGTTPMGLLYVRPLAPSSTKVTILTATEPRLINPVTIPLSGGAIDIALFAAGYPAKGVPAGTNFTVTYQYPLGASYYSVSGGKVTVDIPNRLPVKAFTDSFTVSLSLPPGAAPSQSAPSVLGSRTPWQGGRTDFSYGLSIGWAVDAGVPGASLVFVLLLVGLFAARTTTAQAEETEEEEDSTELASDMIKAFDEKTTLINGLWQEISAKDPNDLDKEYFDDLRGRLDSFRSRALQRLNEVKQKSTGQKFLEVVNQMQQTEREVDRAAKDKLNLYQQFYLRQMRKEVFDRLLPQYTKRLEKALDQLSDEIHTVQREAKLL